MRTSIVHFSFTRHRLLSCFAHITHVAEACALCSLDFNDIVNPAARTFVEGLFGLRPDVPNKVIKISPQLSPTWDNATLTTPYLKVHATGFRQALGTALGSTTVSIQLTEGYPMAVVLVDQGT